MTLLQRFSRLAVLALDAVLPRSCVLCGRPLVLAWPSGPLARPDSPRKKLLALGERRPPPPLCPQCMGALHPITGPRCERCGIGLISEQGLCLRCRERDWSFDRVFALFSYEGAFKRLLTAYKFGDRRSLAPLFAALFAECIESRWPDRVLVPVPPRPGKLRERGWDQVESIARILERQGFVVRRILRRRGSSQQKRLGLRERRDNARTAYCLVRGASVPSDILLIDDVVTTCATAEACAAALRAAGAASVSVLALAAD